MPDREDIGRGDFGRALQALERPLVFAARDNFSGIDDVTDLGGTLQRASRRLEALLSEEQRGTLGDYAAALDGFEQLDRLSRTRLVARGLRLCHQFSDRRPAPRTAPLPQGGAELGLRAPTTVLRGVGPVVAERLAAREILVVEDLLFLLPRSYRDQRQEVSFEALRDGEVATISGVVVAARSRRMRGGRRMVELEIAEHLDAPTRLWCVWFHGVVGIVKRFDKGSAVRVSGQVKHYRDRLQMTHPDISAPSAGAIRRRYPDVPGVAPGKIEALCKEATRRFAKELTELLPVALSEALELPTQQAALETIHLANELDGDELAALDAASHPALVRLAFEELFALQLAVALRRRQWSGHQTLVCTIDDQQLSDDLERALPFALTGAQRRAIDQIAVDMARSEPMHRLLQGDVGAGKTAVAFAAATIALRNGGTVLLMAPTEALAAQHHAVLSRWGHALGMRVGLLTGSTKPQLRRSIVALASAKQVPLLIGTQALLSSDVELPDLALAIVDEQHRFGVSQRAALRLRRDAGHLPHLLVMTATPIPRTLALTVYGDLDVSILDEKPPGRLPPTTVLHQGGVIEQGSAAHAELERFLAAKERAFVICPLIERSEKIDVSDVISTHQRLSALFPQAKVGLLHGQMSAEQRAEQIAGFGNGTIDLLVSTTIVEVGIDLPGVNVMVIEHAERFGMAQLHQLRGRIGRRAGSVSSCLLLCAAEQESAAYARLRVLAESADGFVIAEADLDNRGPGEIFGTRQSGRPRMRFADLRHHLSLLQDARDAIDTLLKRDPMLRDQEHAAIRQEIERRFGGRTIFGVEAG
ncbi:MAG: ATP-dependent DNA helicase RecG [Deltaproteobacteria bacterium]|nr:ATP-dependent DNA helicase RecG [Deltaproteobacteria bacterium]